MVYTVCMLFCWLYTNINKLMLTRWSIYSLFLFAFSVVSPTTFFFLLGVSSTIDCMRLGQYAVHGAMAGYTGFSVGLCNNRMVFLPIPILVATSPRSMNPQGRTWERILAQTRQPNTVVAKEEKK